MSIKYLDFGYSLDVTSLDYVVVRGYSWSPMAVKKAVFIKKLLQKNGLKSHFDEKTEKSALKTRSKIRQLLTLNLNHTSRFITLTYADNVQDYKKATKDFNNMISSFNQDKNKADKLQYLVVKEHQKRGAIHYHMITFNHEKVKWSYLWKHGATHQKYISDLNPAKIANYFTKYLVKKDDEHQQIAVGFRAFGYSRNLIKPEKFKVSIDDVESFKSLYIYDVFKTEYGSYFNAIVKKNEFEKRFIKKDFSFQYLEKKAIQDFGFDIVNIK